MDSSGPRNWWTVGQDGQPRSQEEAELVMSFYLLVLEGYGMKNVEDH